MAEVAGKIVSRLFTRLKSMKHKNGNTHAAKKFRSESLVFPLHNGSRDGGCSWWLMTVPGGSPPWQSRNVKRGGDDGACGCQESREKEKGSKEGLLGFDL